jgi:hypothetical protein
MRKKNGYCRTTGKYKKAVVWLCVALLTTSPQAAKLYRWVDKNGQVHYSDQVPSDVSGEEHRELNEHGITVRIKEREKTPAEKAAERARLAQEAEKDKARRQQATYDHMLLESFASVEAIEAAHQEKIDAVKARITLTKARIAQFNKHLEQAYKEAADHELAGTPVPKILLDKIAMINEQIQTANTVIESQLREEEAIRQHAEQDKKRFQELTSKDKKS